MVCHLLPFAKVGQTSLKYTVPNSEALARFARSRILV